MKNSIQTRYPPGRMDSADPHSEDEPARFRREITLPPEPDADGTFGYVSVGLGGEEDPGILAFAPQSRLQIDTRAGSEGAATVVAIRICVGSADGSRMEEGLVEFIEDEGDRRIRAVGLLEGMALAPQSYDGKDGVWTVPLGEIEFRLDWVEPDDDTEILIEAASAEN